MPERFKYDGYARCGSLIVRYAMDAQIENMLRMTEGMDTAHTLLSLRAERNAVREIITNCRNIVSTLAVRDEQLTADITFAREVEGG